MSTNNVRILIPLFGGIFMKDLNNLRNLFIKHRFIKLHRGGTYQITPQNKLYRFYDCGTIKVKYVGVKHDTRTGN